MSRSEKRQRTEVLLGIRCYPEEKKQIQEKAEVAGLSVGEFLRRCALSRRIIPRTDVKLIVELSKLGGLQKHLFNEGKGVHSQAYSEILVALKKAILKIDMEV
ncbi:plasmid mobilization protein MobA [Candidatus Fukatsuia symbiotica]|uniref:Mobilization protein n=1 Tax=Candidatus Fukatsuia symbiotica TaxID=1878942 RepID=A0A2U8I9G9_9GAMM|nr:plasmid mobilization protein MobA [Candidatus Fukatsuia symbiotica]AWK15698.1 mobilization protein [Candidatus Fukatsuia symbiotica]MEA9446109.1 plasmid mobilization protein MobA [Candidatus Fukatsuia symbiotica]